jgi:hypothetical protein
LERSFGEPLFPPPLRQAARKSGFCGRCESVVSERVFISPKGRRFRILRTTEKDPYDPPDDQGKDEQGKKDK